jgi:hypothetical protein
MDIRGRLFTCDLSVYALTAPFMPFADYSEVQSSPCNTIILLAPSCTADLHISSSLLLRQLLPLPPCITILQTCFAVFSIPYCITTFPCCTSTLRSILKQLHANLNSTQHPPTAPCEPQLYAASSNSSMRTSTLRSILQQLQAYMTCTCCEYLF